jgi:hypothetical protein
MGNCVSCFEHKRESCQIHVNGIFLIISKKFSILASGFFYMYSILAFGFFQMYSILAFGFFCILSSGFFYVQYVVYRLGKYTINLIGPYKLSHEFCRIHKQIQ